MKIAIVLADGFEEIEAVVPADVLLRLGFEVVLAGLGKEVKGSHGLRVRPDCLISDLEADGLSAAVLPGGMPGSLNLKNSSAVLSLVKKNSDAGKVTAAICAAPIALHAAGLLKGRRVTAHPSVKDQLAGAEYTGSLTEVDGKIITGKGPGAAYEFACRIAEALGKKAEAARLMKDMFIASA